MNWYILDLKGDPGEIELMVDGRKIFKGYHMNKCHWFTICLDGRMGDDEIKTFVRESYERAGRFRWFYRDIMKAGEHLS